MAHSFAASLTSNLIGPPRRVTENGTEYLVVPAVLINPGILPGSKGPLRYTANDTKAATSDWNGVPLTVRHPFDPLTNVHLSASDPGVWERQGIGNIREAEFDGRLRSEAWIDVRRADGIDKRIVNSLENGRPVELSTGLYTEQEPAPPNATLNGRPYVAYARRHQPDHVAVLPDERGACGIDDGCGLLVNSWHPAKAGPNDCGDWGGRKRKAKRQATANFLTRLDQLWVVNVIDKKSLLARMGKQDAPATPQGEVLRPQAATKPAQSVCKPGQTAAKTGCTPKEIDDTKAARDLSRKAKNASELAHKATDAIERPRGLDSKGQSKAARAHFLASLAHSAAWTALTHVGAPLEVSDAHYRAMQAHREMSEKHEKTAMNPREPPSSGVSFGRRGGDDRDRTQIPTWNQQTVNEWSDAARAAALLARQASMAARKASNAAGGPKAVGLGPRSFQGDPGKKAMAAAKLAVETAQAGLGRSHPLGPDSYHRKAATQHEAAAREHEMIADSAHKQGQVALGMMHSQAASAHKRAASLHMTAAGQVSNKATSTAAFIANLDALYVLNCGGKGSGFLDQLDQLWVVNTGRQVLVVNAKGGSLLSGGGPNWRDLTGGHWVTTEEGHHIYIKGGRVAAGNPHFIDAIEKEGADVSRVETGPGSRGAAGGAEKDVRRVAKGAGKPRSQGDGGSGDGEGVPSDKEAVAAVSQRLDRYAKVFKAKGEHEAAEWMEMLKDHIVTVGVDHALAALGEQRQGGFAGKVQYEGAYDDPGDTQKESDFIRAYLRHASVVLLHGNTAVDPKAPLVSGWSEANLKQEGRDRTAKAGDYIPTDATFKHKLEETQHLPGLESTQDIHDAIGHKVTSFTPEVMKQLDAKYGKGRWIVKSYGDEAYAGFGVMFPQRVKQIQADAKATVAAARDELKGYGYQIARDKDGTAVGLKQGKNLMHFGSKEFNALPKAVKTLGKQVQQAAPSENGTRLPTSPEQSLQNNYGVTLRRDKDGVPNGIVDWDGREHALDSKHVQGMEGQDGGAMGHELHRALEADEWRRKGFSTEPKFMVGPAFKAVGVSASDRALGATWETANEGRVHCITRDGKASVVPYATLAGRGDSMPAVFATKDVRDMEKAVEDAVNKLPASERAGQLYAPDVVKTKDGWRVLELNPAAAGGGSDWLGRNPFVMDAVASHAVGREPMHARFIRDLIAKATGKGARPLSVPSVAPPKTLPPKSGTPKSTPDEQNATHRLNPSLTQPLGGGKVGKDVTVNMAEEQPRDDHGRWSGAGNAVRTVKLGRSKVRFQERAPKQIDGPSLGLRNYRQKDDHSCSYVAALAVVHHFDRSVNPTDVLKSIRPTVTGGLSRGALRSGLKELGIDTKYKKNLTVADLRRHVNAGNPVMLTVFPKDWSSDHWTVVEGFSGDRVHLSNHKSMPIKQFKDEWYDKGEGLICRKAAVPDKAKATANFLHRLDQLWVANVMERRFGGRVKA